jgi:hypothetical protein
MKGIIIPKELLKLIRPISGQKVSVFYFYSNGKDWWKFSEIFFNTKKLRSMKSVRANIMGKNYEEHGGVTLPKQIIDRMKLDESIDYEVTYRSAMLSTGSWNVKPAPKIGWAERKGLVTL